MLVATAAPECVAKIELEGTLDEAIEKVPLGVGVGKSDGAGVAERSMLAPLAEKMEPSGALLLEQLVDWGSLNEEEGSGINVFPPKDAEGARGGVGAGVKDVVELFGGIGRAETSGCADD